MRTIYSREIQLEKNVEMALFYGDISLGEVVSSSANRACVSDIMTAGVNILDALGIDRGEFGNIMSGTDSPIAVVTHKGLGIISPMFYISSGLYVYAHIGGRRSSLARVLALIESRGYAVLGNTDNSPAKDEDIPTLRAAEDIIRDFEDIKFHTAQGHSYADDTDLKNIYQLQRLLSELCGFCGADADILELDGVPDAYASAGDMRTLVSTFLVCISAAKSVSADKIKVGLGVDGGFWVTDIEFTYRKRDDLPIAEARRYIELTAAVTGMKFMYFSSPVSRPEKFKRGKFASMRLVLVHSSNPDVGIAWGVKAGNILLEN